MSNFIEKYIEAAKENNDLTNLAPCKHNGFRQVNGFLTPEQNDMLEEISEVTGISKKDLVTKMVVDSLEGYIEKITPIVEIKKMYEDAKKNFIFG